MSKNKTKGAILGKQTIKQYWSYVRKRKWSFITALVTIPAAAVMFDTVVPYWLSMAIGTLTNHTDSVSTFLVYATLAASLGILFNFVGFQMLIRHEGSVSKNIAGSTLEKIMQKDIGFFGNQKIGALTSRYIDYVSGHIDIQDLFIIRSLTFIVSFVFGVGLIFSAAPLLALAVIVFVGLLVLQVKISTYLRRDNRKKRRDLRSESHGMAADILTNYFTVKTFGKESQELNNFDNLNERYRQAHVRDFSWLAAEGTGRLFLSMVVQIGSIAAVAGMLAAGQAELGIAVFALAYLQRIASQIFSLGELLNGYDKILLASTPITEILLEPPIIKDAPNAAELTVRQGSIDFTDVNYAYRDDKSTKVIQGFNLHIPAGQRVGLVGVSGAGKTTITKLLLRFDDIEQGSISIDGQDIAKVTQQSLRENIAYVPQGPMLFHRTLRENISYAHPKVVKQQLLRRPNALTLMSLSRNYPKA